MQGGGAGVSGWGGVSCGGGGAVDAGGCGGGGVVICATITEMHVTEKIATFMQIYNNSGNSKIT